MADFEKAFITLTNDITPSYLQDGVEEYMGISRLYHPIWEGWDTIDDLSYDKESFPRNLDDDDELYSQVLKFYEFRYWDELRLDEVDDQEAANCLFIYAYNFGCRMAIINLQITLNYLTENGDMYDEIPTLGVMDDDTLDAINTLTAEGYGGLLLDTIHEEFFERVAKPKEDDHCSCCGLEECSCCSNTGC